MLDPISWLERQQKEYHRNADIKLIEEVSIDEFDRQKNMPYLARTVKHIKLDEYTKDEQKVIKQSIVWKLDTLKDELIKPDLSVDKKAIILINYAYLGNFLWLNREPNVVDVVWWVKEDLKKTFDTSDFIAKQLKIMWLYVLLNQTFWDEFDATDMFEPILEKLDSNDSYKLWETTNIFLDIPDTNSTVTIKVRLCELLFSSLKSSENGVETEEASMLIYLLYRIANKYNDQQLLQNIDEYITTNYQKFFSKIEDLSIKLDEVNENTFKLQQLPKQVVEWIENKHTSATSILPRDWSTRRFWNKRCRQ